MHQTEIHSFLTHFFNENQCDITLLSPKTFQVQLTKEMDKALMNRPFYWHYVEKTGAEPQPATLTLKTAYEDEEKQQAEFIHFGSPRLHEIFRFVEKKGAHGKFYEGVKTSSQAISLKPWLSLNGKISYKCHQKRETFFSIGLSLITGEMLNDFHTLIDDRSYLVTIPDYCFTLTPLIKPGTGISRIQNHIKKKIENDNHEWADIAEEKMKKDLSLLDIFYDDVFPKPASYEKEKEAIIEQYKPIIELSIINGGLFYLYSHPLAQK
ncbi:hypothetical protein HXA31_05175 [Salipaludibacillus agaradhaerens]|uniref:YqhG n=1 Tax=Salipaludibacillus agaradhaerens TaxID=76935 RepID=A0A9Q4B202_SALAG|nr:YqhG family protein [Salipaludibacillus agaradhaerens]MCR6096695.1 hypothetical protein [Salipaludibacillus agaradhaerens]MCR6113746.1 hypothetical protein [Salipaludibacillus agaradhaerens]